MQVYYNGFDSFNVTDMLEYIPESYHDKFVSKLEDFLNRAYDEGKEDGIELGTDEAFEYGRADEWADSEIADGGFDESVRARAEKLGYVMPKEPGQDLQQEEHLAAGHTLNGPIGWEYCARC